MASNQRPNVPDRPERVRVRLPSLRRDRPTRPASDFLEAVTRETAALPEGQERARRASIARAAGRVGPSFGVIFRVIFRILRAHGFDLELVRRAEPEDR